MNQKAINDGGCAYPITLDFTGPSTNPLTGKAIAANHTDRHIDLGLTKRDWLAGLAMQARLSDFQSCQSLGRSADANGISFGDEVAAQSYAMADAMIRARQA